MWFYKNKAKKQEIIDNLEAKINSLDRSIKDKQAVLQEIQTKINYLHDEISVLSKSYNRLKGYETIEELGDSFELESTCFDEITKKISELQDQLAELIGNDKHFVITKKYRIDNSERKGQIFQKNYCENLIIGFNAYYNKKLKSVNSANYNKTIDLLTKAFDKYNKKGQQIGITIAQDYLNIKLSILRFTLEKNINKQLEQEKIKQERQRLKEEQQLLLEAEKERKRLEEEKKAMDIAFAKALTEEERNQIKEQLTSIDKRLSDIDFRVNNPKAGWVYLIDSKSLPGMYKCGVTRRLSGPMERVKELSTSSLPWPFELKAYCFSEDAFDIESKMHNYFDSKRVADNREFFYGEIKEAIDVLSNIFNQDVHFGTYEKELDKNENM